MKTTPIGALGKNVLTSLTVFAVANALNSSPLYAQQVASANPTTLAGQSALQPQPTATLQAHVYPLGNSLKFRMHYVNPQGGPVTLLIRDSKGEIVY